jgi:predicted HAD superfamily phosphohydrolase YqeG
MKIAGFTIEQYKFSTFARSNKKVFMTKALFFDIDGTLVSFNTHRIPQSTIEAIETAHTKGIKIFIATGRPKSIINNLSELQKQWLSATEEMISACCAMRQPA